MAANKVGGKEREGETLDRIKQQGRIKKKGERRGARRQTTRKKSLAMLPAAKRERERERKRSNAAVGKQQGIRSQETFLAATEEKRREEGEIDAAGGIEQRI